jgi:hypothetical protein
MDRQTFYQVVYWRDIPAQIKLRAGRDRRSYSLPPRFQEAIDEAAMLSRATSTDAYLEDWRTSDWKPIDGEPDQLATDLLAAIEADYSPERLKTIVVNKGYNPEP